jgi:hypothetical protein
MYTRKRIGFKRLFQASQDADMQNSFVAAPRLWIVLLLLAVPFFAICVDYFETLERSGTLGAIVADIALPASLIGYMMLLVALKRRKI